MPTETDSKRHLGKEIHLIFPTITFPEDDRLGDYSGKTLVVGFKPGKNAVYHKDESKSEFAHKITGNAHCEAMRHMMKRYTW
jgi:hypothetical protein